MRQRLIAIALIALAAPVAARAQARWSKPYESGVRAVTEGRWRDAIRDLDQAVRFADRQEADKVIEGTFRTDYFPYVYLFIAHANLGQLDQARVNLEKATERPLPPRIDSILKPHRDAYERALKPKPVPAPPPAPPPSTATKTAAPPPRTPVPEVDPRLTQELAAVESALTTRRYADALATLDAIRKQFPDEYNKRGLAARRDDAARGRAAELAAEGQTLFKAGRLADAKSRFDQAEVMSAGTGQPGLAAIRARQAEYTKLKAAGDRDAAAGRQSDARQTFLKAREADPEAYRTDNLGARVADLDRQIAARADADAHLRQLTNTARTLASEGKYAQAAEQYRQLRQADPGNIDAAAWLEANEKYESLKSQGTALHRDGKLEEALQPLLGARLLDPRRFDADGLDDLLNAVNASRTAAAAAELAPVRDALTALLKGNTDETLRLLEPLSRPDELQKLTPPIQAHVHAYLGVAYATRALLAAEATARDGFDRQARAQFAKVIAIRPDYQLSQLISPRIQAMLQAARGR